MEEVDKYDQGDSAPAANRASAAGVEERKDPKLEPTEIKTVEATETDSQPNAESELEAELSKKEMEIRAWSGRLKASEKRHRLELEELKSKLEALALAKAEERAEPRVDPGKIFAEHFGEEGAKAQLTGIDAIVESKLSAVRSEVESLRKSKTESEKRAYVRELAKLMPDWEAINLDPNFELWAGHPNGVGSSRTIADDLREAHASMDSERVCDIFAAYKANRKSQEGPKPSGILDSAVSPGRARNQGPDEKKPAPTTKETLDSLLRRGQRGDKVALAEWERLYDQYLEQLAV